MAQDGLHKRIKELETRLSDLKSRLPSSKDKRTGLHIHPDPTNMLMEIEDIEEELKALKSSSDED
jgi:hypothetical protein